MRAHLSGLPVSRSRAAALSVVVSAMALFAGCGGGSEADPTREAFIAEADSICSSFAAGADALESQFDQALKSGDLAGAAGDFQDQAADVTTMLDQLSELEVPSADQTLMRQLLDLGRQRVGLAEEAARAIASGDKNAMIAAGKEGSKLAGEYFRLADSIGFKACGSGGAGVEGRAEG